MSDQWINDNLHIHIDNDVFNDIDNELNVKRFQGIKMCRVQ